MLIEIFCTLIPIFGIFIFYHFYWKRKDLPPGPTPLPFVGNLPEISKCPPGYDAYIGWKHKYGPVYTYWVGEKPLVAITDYDIMMETLVKDGDSYTDRDYYNEFLSILRGGKYGVVIQEGDEWKEQRKFIMSVFTKLGVGKNLLEQRILSEISAMISSIDKDIEAGLEHGKYDIKPRVEVCIASTINLLLLGYEFHGERSHEFHELNSLVIQYMTLVGQPDAQILMFRPYLYNWPYFNKIFAKFQKFIGGMFDFFDRQIEEIQKDANFNEYGEPTDYVTAFLREMKTRENEGYTMIELRNNLLEVWNAGQDTTTVTLLWSIIYMIHHQDIQQKVQEELDQVIGADRLITIEDKPYLPYTSAVTNEVQRCSNILPQNLARKTTRDVTIGGYKVKKGTAVMPMISVVLYDEKIFPNPKEFNPNHFLTSDGQLKKVDQLIPFSIGKRFCLGENLAKMEIFLIFSNLFNHYRISEAANGEFPSLEKEFGLTTHPKPFKCTIEKRKHP